MDAPRLERPLADLRHEKRLPPNTGGKRGRKRIKASPIQVRNTPTHFFPAFENHSLSRRCSAVPGSSAETSCVIPNPFSLPVCRCRPSKRKIGLRTIRRETVLRSIKNFVSVFSCCLFHSCFFVFEGRGMPEAPRQPNDGEVCISSTLMFCTTFG